MPRFDSPRPMAPIQQARVLLAEPARAESAMSVVAAAAFFAMSALALAVMIIAMPPRWG